MLNAGANATNSVLTVKGHNTCGDGGIKSFDIKVIKKLAVKLWLQGLYDMSLHNMIKVQNLNGDQFGSDTTDIVYLYLAQKNFPFSYTDTNIAALKTNGIAYTQIRSTVADSSYIVIKHRNSMETWSTKAVNFNTDSIYYDFTNSINKAYGDNLMWVSQGAYAIYSGDTYQDGVINIFDLSDVFDYINDPMATEGYSVEDLNGDGVVNIFDLAMVFDNVNLGVNIISPMFPLKK